MNREIKFRAWNPDDNKMEYPLVFAVGDYGSKLKPLINCIGGRAYKDYPIMQFTGLCDKKGIEIYEGDVVKVKSASAKPIQVTHKGKNLTAYEPIYENWFVVFYKGCFGLHNEPTAESHESKSKYNGTTYAGDLRGKYDIEIIGNIYDNPELLEKKQ
jgi:uncharacterized phage protein (TIGR01671 family)